MGYKKASNQKDATWLLLVVYRAVGKFYIVLF